MSYTAIFGGTFNPFHVGHYEILKALQNDDEVEKIFIMPDSVPPHKVCDCLADNEIRIEMCRIVAEDFSKAEVCLIEFEREGKSYTYDTVVELKKRYPTDNFAFVCGGDMLVYFDKWYRYEDLSKLISFIAFRRSDTDNTIFDNYVKKFREMGMSIKVMDNVIPSVSSSLIRNNFSIAQKLLPKRVFNYLNNKGIYNGK